MDARSALETGSPALILKWVHSEDEAAILAAFEEVLAVRNLSATAKALADRWFFETLVRIHRAGEGALYTGLKDAGTADAGIEAADHALRSGDPQSLVDRATQHVSEGLTSRFNRVRALAPHKERSAEDGRAYVAAYVEFIHFAEAVITKHSHAPGGGEPHQH